MLKRRLLGATRVSGSLLGPPALELERDRVRVGEGWLASFAVVAYPSEVARGWLWGPAALARTAEWSPGSPGNVRAAVYFDKARLEITDPDASPSPWFVTGGLLITELLSGELQLFSGPESSLH